MTLQKTYKQLTNNQINHRLLIDERSAGAVVFYMEDNSEPEYLLLHYSAGHWDFPKGNIETGENEKQTTIREIWEETSITGIEFLDDFRMKIEYKYRHGKKLVQKEVVLYLVRAHTRKVILSHEHIGFAWRKFDDAMQQLSYLNAKNLLSAAKEHLQQRSLAYR
jgi:bis(5'-nucleosidyl)-tetraphosphatase